MALDLIAMMAMLILMACFGHKFSCHGKARLKRFGPREGGCGLGDENEILWK